LATSASFNFARSVTILLASIDFLGARVYSVAIELSLPPPPPPKLVTVGTLEFLSQRKTAIEGPVTESTILELLKAGKEAELRGLYTNWSVSSDR